ncbi:hypothetical protein [Roseobacter sp. AzwK-3b]|uniref:hypothetical protein n=1 Tax=Roseobacter sp. AzwK-3b TaxID=351016 RepID=UPI0012F4FCB4|nr:hypothetical protein [Roseobacter sp. AzwK-3b]
MARRRYRNNGYRYQSRPRNLGYEAAKKHIEEAQQLTRELGGTDQDVKRYFFSLANRELKAIMDEYGRQFGRDKQDYAERTFLDWKSGRRKMSGTVAGRLFSLLPPRMPLEKKYDLVESLWKHLGPKSNTTFTVGADVSAENVIQKITDHTLAVVKEFEIPDNFERRFEWLAAGDVAVRQKLLNHFQDLERKAIIYGAQQQVPAVIDHLSSSEGHLTHFATQELKVGNHTVRLEFDKNHTGITEGSFRPISTASKSSNDDRTWLGWIIGAAIIIFVFVLFGG